MEETKRPPQNQMNWFDQVWLWQTHNIRNDATCALPRTSAAPAPGQDSATLPHCSCEGRHILSTGQPIQWLWSRLCTRTDGDSEEPIRLARQSGVADELTIAMICRRTALSVVSWDPLGLIYTTKIDGVVCPPNISETVAVITVISHTVHVFPRQRSNSFQNQFYCPFYKLY